MIFYVGVEAEDRRLGNNRRYGLARDQPVRPDSELRLRTAVWQRWPLQPSTGRASRQGRMDWRRNPLADAASGAICHVPLPRTRASARCGRGISSRPAISVIVLRGVNPRSHPESFSDRNGVPTNCEHQTAFRCGRAFGSIPAMGTTPPGTLSQGRDFARCTARLPSVLLASTLMSVLCRTYVPGVLWLFSVQFRSIRCTLQP